MAALKSALIIAVVMTGSCFIVAKVVDFSFGRPVQGSPQLDCIDRLNLGEVEFNETIPACISIKNVGTASLLLTNFRTSCSCANVQIRLGEQLQQVEFLELLPNESREVIVPVIVTSQPGTPQIVSVHFHTNDPTVPAHHVVITVSKVIGGFAVSPRSVIFGKLKFGTGSVEQRLFLYENSSRPFKVTEVTSSHSDRFTAKIAEMTSDEIRFVDKTLGRIHTVIVVTPNTSQIGPLDGDLSIKILGDKSREEVLSVSGVVVP